MTSSYIRVYFLPHTKNIYKSVNTHKCKIEMRLDLIVNTATDFGAVSSAAECFPLTQAAGFSKTLLKDGRCYGTDYTSMTPSTSCNLQCSSGEECGGASSYSLYSEGTNSFTVSKSSAGVFSVTASTATIEDSYFLLKPAS